ncbi:MAG: DegT/DnrJ/EryC1/StrS aminotransferase family protein [Ignavibacteriaceae bacterium]|nr:DegT/DnrJ/EryC1/StrS aminotransferase family protein [Ignavibacteriaceae bacterium]
MKIKFPVYKPSLSGNEKKYVMECLESTWISSKGKFINQFEQGFSEYLGIKYSAAVSNGTVALHAALLALGIGKDDEVIVPTFTYIASVNAIHYTGAIPVFVDSKEDTWQMDPEEVRRKLTKKTKAVMAVHLYGDTCEMDELVKFCKENNLYLIEDTAEAFGSKYNGKFAGTFGDISTFSFFGNKTITTGEGGMVSTNNKELYDLVFKIKGQGLAAGKEYFHDIVGYNYRMTNICAAVGSAQLENADVIITKKREIANWYNKNLRDLPLQLPKESKEIFHTYWMYTVMVDDPDKRDKLRSFLKENGIETRPAFHPVHQMPMYYKKGVSFPVAESLALKGFNLPSYPELEEIDVEFISKIINEFFS